MGQDEEYNSELLRTMLGLADKVAADSVVNVDKKIPRAVQALMGTLPKYDKNAWTDVLKRWVKLGLISEETMNALANVPDQFGILNFIVGLILILKMITAELDQDIAAFGMDRQQKLIAKAGIVPAPVEALVRSMMVDPGRATENRAEMKKYGYNDTQIDNIILAAYQLIDLNTIRINYLRGNYDTDKLYERMRELGYTDTRIKEIVQTWTVYPSPQDLFTMVAHEAFEPDMYTKLGLSEEFPEEQVPWLEAQGISREWAMKYWISHWNEPSLEQGFEMFHRGVITRDDLDMLFRVVEIPRYWREKLMAITYEPFTRVDVRRMHELGVLSTQELVKAYMDLGYDQEKAVKMAEFTIKDNAQGETELTRSTILECYREDLITRNQAKELLTQQGYNNDTAEFYLTHEEYERDKEILKINIDTVHDAYTGGGISEAEARKRLNSMGLRGTKIDALLANWNLELQRKQDLPTKAELFEMLIQGVISESDWRAMMTRLGYAITYQNWYLELLKRGKLSAQALPTRTDLTTWLKKKLISVDEYRDGMKKLGYSDRHIDLYLKSM